VEAENPTARRLRRFPMPVYKNGTETHGALVCAGVECDSQIVTVNHLSLLLSQEFRQQEAPLTGGGPSPELLSPQAASKQGTGRTPIAIF